MTFQLVVTACFPNLFSPDKLFFKPDFDDVDRFSTKAYLAIFLSVVLTFLLLIILSNQLIF